MAQSAAGLLAAGPEARALRRVITLNHEIDHQLQRIMGLKETDFSAMALLMRRPMGPTELARALHITTASATAMVDRLVRAGHVVREPHPEDRRRMVEGMVEGLETRLATQGGAPDEWARLIGALVVIGRQDHARDILAEARARFAATPEALAVIAEAAGKAGLE